MIQSFSTAKPVQRNECSPDYLKEAEFVREKLEKRRRSDEDDVDDDAST